MKAAPCLNNQNAYSTSNFFNNTMAQMNQGKDTEVNPLVRRRVTRTIHPVIHDSHSTAYHFTGFSTPGHYVKKPFADHHYIPRIDFTPQFAQENEDEPVRNDISADIF